MVEINESGKEGAEEGQEHLERPPRAGTEAEAEAVEHPADEVGVDVRGARVELLENDVAAFVDGNGLAAALDLGGDRRLREVLLGVTFAGEVPREDRRDLDAVVLELVAERVAERLERHLEWRILGVADEGVERHGGGEDDNVFLAVGAGVLRVCVEHHPGDERVQKVETRLVVDVDAGVELGEREVGKELRHGRPCAAEDHVWVDHLLAQEGPQLLDLGGVGKVDRVGNCELVGVALVLLVLRCQLVELVLRAGKEHEVGAAVVQLVCQRAAEPLRGAGHDDDSVKHFEAHRKYWQAEAVGKGDKACVCLNV